ncbi:hypothetical protein CEXT_441991 [Caerostris extrusa]|uniref:Uncharacterized protein n=1 Tax=Caerostris extrusa TaxID=172846 RepID=A0AAV4QJQ8_CAEEX|nr:hypothetical protein CEXT_441991 [Caerostris extrusa]
MVAGCLMNSRILVAWTRDKPNREIRPPLTYSLCHLRKWMRRQRMRNEEPRASTSSAFSTNKPRTSLLTAASCSLESCA